MDCRTSMLWSRRGIGSVAYSSRRAFPIRTGSHGHSTPLESPIPVKRTLAKVRTRKLPPQLFPAAERLRELEEAHMAAIRGDDEAFYTDGRHHELVSLLPVISAALDIKPWEDLDAIVREAIASN
jgi:hypothetical protein